ANPFRSPSGPAAECPYAGRRPILDGVLSDACWKDAGVLMLGAAVPETRDAPQQATLFLCYDREYLYVAGSVPYSQGGRSDGPIGRERRHDEDLEDFDRVILSLDIDRDYVTAYEFAIDQRGCTAESCWKDGSWDPQWFVAVARDKAQWRFE